jgi:chorismate mutase
MSGTLLQLIGLRGATTCPENSSDAIQKAVADLIDALVDRNDLSADRIISVTFSVTGDLNACFPAAVARSRSGWDRVALLDCQQMAVGGDLERCIRVLALAWLPEGQLPIHPYLEGARMLRPDRSSHN